jgi:hypothetical protein
MKQGTIDFNIKLPTYGVTHIKQYSFYNRNYYKLKEYGDWLILYGNDILKQRYDECDNFYTYSFGKFEGDKFIRAITWTINEDILEGINILEE